MPIFHSAETRQCLEILFMMQCKNLMCQLDKIFGFQRKRTIDEDIMPMQYTATVGERY